MNKTNVCEWHPSKGGKIADREYQKDNTDFSKIDINMICANQLTRSYMMKDQ